MPDSDAKSPQAASADLRTRRFESEAARNEAERLKLEAETAELRQRLGQKWYSGRLFLQATVGGIVASALMATWVIGYLQPILRKNEEVVKLELKRLELANTIQSQNNELQRQENERKTKDVVADGERAKTELTLLARQNAELLAAQAAVETRAKQQQATLDELAERYTALAAQQQNTEQEKRRLQGLAERAEAQSNALAREIQQVAAQKAATSVRSEKIDEQLRTRAIRGAAVKIIYIAPRVADAKAISKRLSDLGATVTLYSVGDSANEEFVKKLYYYGDTQIEAAQQIKAVIAEIEPVEVTAGKPGLGPQMNLWIGTVRP
jgi:DNA repair exonuclease SbcCD ATPase subunit